MTPYEAHIHDRQERAREMMQFLKIEAIKLRRAWPDNTVLVTLSRDTYELLRSLYGPVEPLRHYDRFIGYPMNIDESNSQPWKMEVKT